jgi:hypothetical protein
MLDLLNILKGQRFWNQLEPTQEPTQIVEIVTDSMLFLITAGLLIYYYLKKPDGAQDDAK